MENWRCAFYATNALNFLRLLDGWFRFQARQAARDQPFQVMLHPHVNIDLAPVWDDLEHN